MNSGYEGKMGIAMSNELALMHVQDLRFFEDFSSSDFTWLLIGVSLAVVAMWAVSRQRRRWFLIPVITGHGFNRADLHSQNERTHCDPFVDRARNSRRNHRTEASSIRFRR